MSISALIITYRRPAWLARCTLSLLAAAQTAGCSAQLRIRIGVNGPDAEGWSEALSLHQKFPEIVAKPEKFDPGETPAHARNLLLKKTAGAWILFIDDDAFVGENYFQRFFAMVRDFPRIAVIGGPNLTPPDSSPFQLAAGNALCSRFATFTSFSRYLPNGAPRRCLENELILCNLFVRRSCLGEQPFPGDFQCAEENWLLQSIAAQGLQLIHDPGLQVWHERRASLKEFAFQVFKYGFGRGQNIIRRPATMKAAHLIPVAAIFAGLVLLLVAAAGGGGQSLLLPFLAYTCLCVFSARKSASLAFWLRTMALFPVIHVSYGAGIVAGIVPRGR